MKNILTFFPSHPWHQLPPDNCTGQLTNPVEPLQGETPYWENVSFLSLSCKNNENFLSSLKINFYLRMFTGEKKLWSRVSFGLKQSGSMTGVLFNCFKLFKRECRCQISTLMSSCGLLQGRRGEYPMTQLCSKFHQSPVISSQCFSISLNTQETHNVGLAYQCTFRCQNLNSCFVLYV